MNANPANDEDRLHLRTYRMNATVNGLVVGVLCGFGLLLLTVWLVIKGGAVVGPHLSLLSNYFIGYSVTWTGGLIGMLYGFLAGFLVGYGGSRLYNLLVRIRGRF